MSSYIVILGCGHWFREQRPAMLSEPVNGEDRVCAHLSHYPGTTPAYYFPGTPASEELPVSGIRLGTNDWADAFHEWLKDQPLAYTLGEAQNQLRAAWKAALSSVTPHDAFVTEPYL